MFEEMDKEINSFFNSADNLINKYKDNSLVNEESSKYQVFGTRAHTFEMNDEERKKYDAVGNKIENLTKELEILRKGD